MHHLTSLDWTSMGLDVLDTIELNFDERRAINWMRENWHLSCYISILYYLLICFCTKYMTDKYPFHMRKALCLWSFGLSVFSLIALTRITHYLIEQPLRGGWTFSVCDISFYRAIKGKGVYAFLFPLSKLPELFDTLFIVLRKTPLSFLHWYHHVTVFIYCWFSYAYPVSTGYWFGLMNYSVHSLMYFYYGIKAIGYIRIPDIITKTITFIQITQMVLGVLINYLAIRAFMNGIVCGTDAFKIQVSILIYFSYFLLFANFFYQKYIKTPSLMRKNILGGLASGRKPGQKSINREDGTGNNLLKNVQLLSN